MRHIFLTAEDTEGNMNKKKYSIDQYLSDSEFAVRHLYNGLDSIINISKDAENTYSPIKNIEINKEKLNRYLSKMNEYIDLIISKQILCGAILHVANQAIEIFSRNKVVPIEIDELISDANKNKIAKYCIGPELYGIPTGLIIMAGRDQSTHWYKTLRDVIENVFSKISTAFYNDVFNDLEFELDCPCKANYSDRILLIALKWNNFELFKKGIKSLFS